MLFSGRIRIVLIGEPANLPFRIMIFSKTGIIMLSPVILLFWGLRHESY